MEWGREQPPFFAALPSRGRPGGLLTPPFSVSIHRDCARDQRALRAHVCQCVHGCNLTRIALQLLCTFIDDHMRRFGHHIGHRAAVLGLVKALRYASTRSAGPWALTTPALRSKVALM